MRGAELGGHRGREKGRRGKGSGIRPAIRYSGCHPEISLQLKNKNEGTSHIGTILASIPSREEIRSNVILDLIV